MVILPPTSCLAILCCIITFKLNDEMMGSKLDTKIDESILNGSVTVNTDAPSTNVTVYEFPRLDTSLRNIYGQNHVKLLTSYCRWCTENS